MSAGKERTCTKSIIHFYISCDTKNCILYVDHNIHIKPLRIFFMYLRIHGSLTIFQPEKWRILGPLDSKIICS